MLTENKTTWTDRQETVALLDKWHEEGRKDLPKPICAFCGHMTTFIVEPIEWIERVVSGSTNAAKKEIKRVARPVRPGIALVYTLVPEGRAVLDEDIMYIPDRVCVSCIARKDAEQAFTAWGQPHIDLKNRCMSEQDKAQYRRIFKLKFDDLIAEHGQREEKKTKYSLGGKRGR